jgi:hypothetical protein
LINLGDSAAITRGGRSFMKPLSSTRSGSQTLICSRSASPQLSRSGKLDRANENVGMPYSSAWAKPPRAYRGAASAISGCEGPR